MLHTDGKVARCLELVDSMHLAKQIQIYSELCPGQFARAEIVSGGIAAVSDPDLGRKLNHATGLGMEAGVCLRDIDRLEEIYWSRGLPVKVDLCPHANLSSLETFASRGYLVNSFANTYIYTAREFRLTERSSLQFDIRKVGPGEKEMFICSYVKGFSSQSSDRPQKLHEVVANITSSRDDTDLYMATSGGEIVGSAAIAHVETSMGRVAILYAGSTIPEFRGRGVQMALLRARLAEAFRSDTSFACVRAHPWSSSARNAERAGFRLAFTKPTFVKDPPGASRGRYPEFNV